MIIYSFLHIYLQNTYKMHTYKINIDVFCFCCRVIIFFSMCLKCKTFFLDGCDGKQARRTQSSSPLGELFDHGLDSWATFFLPVSLYSVYGRGGMSPIRYAVLKLMNGQTLCETVLKNCKTSFL